MEVTKINSSSTDTFKCEVGNFSYTVIKTVRENAFESIVATADKKTEDVTNEDGSVVKGATSRIGIPQINKDGRIISSFEPSATIEDQIQVLTDFKEIVSKCME